MALVTSPLTNSKPYPFLPINCAKASYKKASYASSTVLNSDHCNPKSFQVKTISKRERSSLFAASNKKGRNGSVLAMANTKSPAFESGPEQKNGRRILLSDVVVTRGRNVYWGRKWNSLDIGTAGVVLAMHLLSLFAPFYFSWRAFWVAFGLYVITGLLGITLSFHRNLSHRSFKLPKWLEYLFAYCGVQALQVCRGFYSLSFQWL